MEQIKYRWDKNVLTISLNILYGEVLYNETFSNSIIDKEIAMSFIGSCDNVSYINKGKKDGRRTQRIRRVKVIKY